MDYGEEDRKGVCLTWNQGRDPSLVVAVALQIFALDVTSAVVCTWDYHSIPIHTPADAPLTSPGGLALFAFEEAFPVTVGQVERQSHDSGGIPHPLDNSIQLSSTRPYFRVVLFYVEGRVVCVAHMLQSGLNSLPVLPNSMDLLIVDVVSRVQMQLGLGKQIICHP